MEEKAVLIESLFEKAGEYAKTNADLFKLKAIDKSADVVSALASKLAFITVGTLIFKLMNIGLALWIGEQMGKSYFGFFTIAFFYVVIAFFLFIFRQQLIKTPVNHSVINQMLKEKGE